MVKRKREVLTIEKSLVKSHHELFKAVKTAKGFERQRLAKRLREPGVTPDKKQKLDLEINVLKSLDLEQTAIAHLYSVLNRIPTISHHPELPEYVRRGIPRPDITEEQKAALHTITSSLFSRPNVRQVVDNIIEETCMVLDVQQPEKKRLRKRKADYCQETEAAEQPTQKESEVKNKEPATDPNRKMTAKEKREEMRRKLLVGIILDDISGDDNEPEGLEDDEFCGFSDSDGDTQDSDNDNNVQDNPEALDSDAAAAAIDKMTALLGHSDSEDSASDFASEDNTPALPFRKANTKTIRVRNVSVSLSESEENADEESESEDDTLTSKAKTKSSAKTAKALASGKPGGSTFLPSLMGGYISGSESEASDLDIAPVRKNRLGQRQRQAIWEKKFGEKAKHHVKQEVAKANKGAEWDAKRGAVWDASKPWKKGMDPSDKEKKEDKPKKVANAMDGGALHPSWEARRKAKEQKQKIIIGAGAPAAKKIMFDD